MTASLHSNYNCWHALIFSDATILYYSTLSYKMHVQTLHFYRKDAKLHN